MTAPSAIAEIREPDAPACIAEIYGLVKSASGIPQVNLIWRHFATEPAVLAYAWNALAPVLRSDVLVREANKLLASVGSGDGRPITESVPAADRATVANVLAFYNRGNSQNLLALTALALFARSGPDRDATPPTDLTLSVPQERIGDVPTLPRRDSLRDEIRANVDRLAGQHRNSAIGVTPSLYLHLALWPDVLAEADRRLAPIVGTDAYQAEVATLMGRADTVARMLTAMMREPNGRPSADVLNPMMATLDRFVSGTIPEMIVVGALLAGDRT